jgi:hypothetical protein
MISMPMQSNTDVGIGAENGSKLQVNVQTRHSVCNRLQAQSDHPMDLAGHIAN